MNKEDISLIINCQPKDIENIDISRFANNYARIYFNIKPNNEEYFEKIINTIETEYYSIWDYNSEYENLDDLVFSYNKKYISIVINISEELTEISFSNLLNILNVYHQYSIYIYCLKDSYKSFNDINKKNLFTKNIHILCVDNINDFNTINFAYDIKYCKYVLFINSLNIHVYKDILTELALLNYDIYGAPADALFYKKWNNHISNDCFFINIINMFMFLNVVNDTNININNIIDINKNINILSIAPKYIMCIFALENYVEDYCRLFNINCPSIAINYNSYINQYNISDYDFCFNNFIYNLYCGVKPKFINYYNSKVNETNNNVAYDIEFYSNNTYNNSFYSFIYDATFVNFKKINDYIDKAKNTNTIPKIIHFCFIDYMNIPDKIKVCIDSWRLKLNNYLFINWTPYIFKDIENIFCMNEFIKLCLIHNKNQFFADYIRMFVLYNYGGIYLDSDIYINKSFTDIIDTGIDYVFDEEINKFTYRLECGCMLAKANNHFIKEILSYYNNLTFDKNISEEEFTNILLNEMILPNVVNNIFKNDDIDIIYGIDDFNDYYNYVNDTNNSNKLYTLNSMFLSAPQMQVCGEKCFNYSEAYASHCFTNSYLK